FFCSRFALSPPRFHHAAGTKPKDTSHCPAGSLNSTRELSLIGSLVGTWSQVCVPVGEARCSMRCNRDVGVWQERLAQDQPQSHIVMSFGGVSFRGLGLAFPRGVVRGGFPGPDRSCDGTTCETHQRTGHRPTDVR